MAWVAISTHVKTISPSPICPMCEYAIRPAASDGARRSAIRSIIR